MARSPTTTKAVTKVMVDPVCGMNVSPGETGLVANYKGGIYYFCAEACRKAFELNPQRYLESRTTKRKGWWDR